MTHTKAITYIIMGGILVFMPLFWKFLTDRENDESNFYDMED